MMNDETDINAPRVADYFAVVGLPQLDSLSEAKSIEQPLPTHVPITDIAVILSSSGEKPPPDYHVIERTPSGYNADLNNGSFRGQSIFLCYKRGTDKQPLVDIGVLFEDKECVSEGCKVVRQTPYGRAAHVNTKSAVGGHRTYLTYRRASNEDGVVSLAVTDIKVFFKNEHPPHSYHIIDKNLNKGTVAGTDVYLCYRKSSIKTPTLAFEPQILSRYPSSNYENYPLSENLPQFCMPTGVAVQCWPTSMRHPLPKFSTFITTSHLRVRLYAAAVTFYEEHAIDNLTNEQVELIGLDDFRSRSVPCTVQVSKCICLLSRAPLFEQMKAFLCYLVQYCCHDQVIPVERLIGCFMHEIPFPGGEFSRILVQFPGTSIVLAPPQSSLTPASGASFIQLLLNLGPERTVDLFAILATEPHLVVHSLRPALLTSVVEALQIALFPFKWCGTYVPICLQSMLEYVQSPTPYIFGMDSRIVELCDFTDTTAVCIDLDTRMIFPPDEKKRPSMKTLPKRPAKVLRLTLARLYQELCSCSLSSFADTELAVDLTPITADLSDISVDKSRREKLECQIREAFVRFMAACLKGYNLFLKPVTKKSVLESSSVGLSTLFDVNGFLRSKSNHKFYQTLMNTMMFCTFIEQRSLDADTDDAFAVFDECCERVDPERNELDNNRYIDVDDSQTSERTKFIEPLCEFNGPEIQYKSFPSFLNSALFAESSLKVTPQTPIRQNNVGLDSPVFGRRTLQEVRSAQKLARSLGKDGSPVKGAAFLLSNCYALFYIMLPSYVRMTGNAIEEYTRLKYGISKLESMLTDLKSAHAVPDDVCYRVLLQLSRYYNRPELAIQVMNVVSTHGLRLNATTYSLYNKLLLECDTNSDVPRAQARWAKVRCIFLALYHFTSPMRNQLQQMTESTHSSEVKDDTSGCSADKGYCSMLLSEERDSPDCVTGDQIGFTPIRLSPIVHRSFALLSNSENRIDQTPIDSNGFSDGFELKRRSWSDLTSASEESVHGNFSKFSDSVLSSSTSKMAPISEEPTDNVPPDVIPVENTLGTSSSDTPTEHRTLQHSKSTGNSSNTIWHPLAFDTSPKLQFTEVADEQTPTDGGDLFKNPFERNISNPVKRQLSLETSEKDCSFESSDSETEKHRKYADILSVKIESEVNSDEEESCSKASDDNVAQSVPTLPGSKQSSNANLSALQLNSSQTSLLSDSSNSMLSMSVNARGYQEQYDAVVKSIRKTGNQFICGVKDLVSQLAEPNQPGNADGSTSNPKSGRHFSTKYEGILLAVNATKACVRINITTCQQCLRCSNLMYDEEIMAGWTMDDSNFKTKCPSCDFKMVPNLLIYITDYRTASKELLTKLCHSSQSNDSLCNESERLVGDGSSSKGASVNSINGLADRDPSHSSSCTSLVGSQLPLITVPYVSPLVLRKQVELLLDNSGHSAFVSSDYVDNKPLIFWNLLWYFKRLKLESHLPALIMHSRTLNGPEYVPPVDVTDARCTVEVNMFWDEIKPTDPILPLYAMWLLSKNKTLLVDELSSRKKFWTNYIVEMVVDGVLDNSLSPPLHEILTFLSGISGVKHNRRNLYREMLFLAIVALGKNRICIDAFNIAYHNAFHSQLSDAVQYIKRQDHPPSVYTKYCREAFGQLDL